MRSSALALSLATLAFCTMPIIARGPLLAPGVRTTAPADDPPDERRMAGRGPRSGNDSDAREAGESRGAASGTRDSANHPHVTGAGVRPRITLWAWERPEDLRFLRGAPFGIAALIATVTLHGDDLDVAPRRQPLSLPSDADVTAVVRLEVDSARRPRLSDAQRQRLVEAMTSLLASQRTFGALQVDFDAPQSARPFYRRLLADLRGALPAETRLSMTALASWCLGDPWLDELPVDEIVPMAFQMGRDAGTVRQHIAAGRDFQPVCRAAIGLALDEPLPQVPRGRRQYIFSSSAWTPDHIRALSGASVR